MQQLLNAFITTNRKLIGYSILRPAENALDWVLARWMCRIFIFEISAIQLQGNVRNKSSYK